MWTKFWEWLFPEPQPVTEAAAGWLAGELSKPVIDLSRELCELIAAVEEPNHQGQ